MAHESTAHSKGILQAIGAAVLFGASTPLSKLLLGQLEPVLLAGLLYMGTGIGLTLWWGLRRGLTAGAAQETPLKSMDLPWLAGAILAGGVIGPVLLLMGLTRTPASTAALLLNLEGVFTAALAWSIFRENFDARIAWGMGAIVVGGIVLSWSGTPELGVPWGALAVGGASLAWAIDNNLTRKVAASDPVQIAAIKGLVAGGVNLGIAGVSGAALPALNTAAGAALVGFFGYGVSLTLFVLALRHIGTARTGAYFSLAPFVGAALAIVLLGEPLTPWFGVALTLMAVGVWLHLTEKHGHEHIHESLEHEHLHSHDAHHQHAHDADASPLEPHAHPHIHTGLKHSHPHYPDIHHRHKH